jgi:homoprotocatechuate degradation regulator HpaR
MTERKLRPYNESLAGTLLAAREAVMAPIRPTLSEAGLTEQQWRVLRVLLDEGPMDLSHLSGSALLRPPSVTRILRELIERELIVRRPDPEDGRRSIVEICDSGAELVRRTAAFTLAVLDGYAERFGAERLLALQRELKELAITIRR